jgi:hypothetical protein
MNRIASPKELVFLPNTSATNERAYMVGLFTDALNKERAGTKYAALHRNT